MKKVALASLIMFLFVSCSRKQGTEVSTRQKQVTDSLKTDSLGKVEETEKVFALVKKMFEESLAPREWEFRQTFEDGRTVTTKTREIALNTIVDGNTLVFLDNTHHGVKKDYVDRVFSQDTVIKTSITTVMWKRNNKKDTIQIQNINVVLGIDKKNLY